MGRQLMHGLPGIVCNDDKQSMDADARTGGILAAGAQLLEVQVTHLLVAEVAVAVFRGALQRLVRKAANVERYVAAQRRRNNRGILQGEMLALVRKRFSGPESADDLEEFIHATPA